MPQDSEQDRKKILQWISPHLPLSTREEAILVYSDFMRGLPNPNLVFYTSELAFGTGGMRGIIGNGLGRMNRWSVGRVTIALCRLMKKTHPSPSIAIAYDCRRMSLDFTQTSAGIAAQYGIRTHIFSEPSPTPALSYSVRTLKAQAGIVITASHNPPEYNGYKVYDSDGAQLLGSFQKKLDLEISSIQDWDSILFLSPKDTQYKRFVSQIPQSLKKSYFKDASKAFFTTSPKNPKKNPITVVYTPLHGTGGNWVPPLLRRNGFKVIEVKSQKEPDGLFPTVQYPNPESPTALEMAKQCAISHQANIFLGTDPDADRLGAGVRNPDSSYTFLNGNQIGSIMCSFLCEKAKNHQKALHQTGSAKPKRRAKIFKTIVTTELQRRIAEAHDVEIHEVLTGFKYIAEQMKKIEQDKNQSSYYLFGGEESFGYLPVDFVRDKDALTSSLLLCEILAEVSDLSAYLDDIYLRYGLYWEEPRELSFQERKDTKQVEKIMTQLREKDLTKLQFGERKVKGVSDFLSKKHLHKQKVLQELPKSNVLQIYLEPEGRLTIRPSGTEPKIKLYTSLKYHGKISNQKELESAKKKLRKETSLVSKHFFGQIGNTS